MARPPSEVITSRDRRPALAAPRHRQRPLDGSPGGRLPAKLAGLPAERAGLPARRDGNAEEGGGADVHRG